MIPLFKVRMHEPAINRAVEVLKSGYIGQGAVVEEFEKYLQEYFNYPYVLTVNSATSGLHLVFHMLKKKFKGTEVLCSPLTCTATNWPVLLNGYKIKWCDVDSDTCNINVDDIMKKMNKDTRILYLIHWGGYPINIKEIKKVRENYYESFGHELMVVEDRAHSMGSRLANYENSYSVYSLQAIKHATSIDGGIILCPDEESYKRAKLLRWYGIDRETNRKDFRCEDNISEVGFKFHMNDVCAAIGIENMKFMDDDISCRKEIVKHYDSCITTSLVRKIPYNFNCSYWLYTMFVERRDDFMDYMKKCNIMVSRVHERNDKHTCVLEYKTDLPILDRVVQEMVCIPCGPWVTYNNLEYIVNCINKGW